MLAATSAGFLRPRRRETLLHLQAHSSIFWRASDQAQVVSRRSILPTGNLATLC
jgi:hypothetical protein